MDVNYLKNFVQSFNSAYLQKLITNVTQKYSIKYTIIAFAFLLCYFPPIAEPVHVHFFLICFQVTSLWSSLAAGEIHKGNRPEQTGKPPPSSGP